MLLSSFQNIHPEFEKLQDIYQKDIQPELQQREQERRTKLKSFKRNSVIIALVSLGGFIGLFAIEAPTWIIVIAVFVAVIAFVIAYIPLSELQSDTHEFLVKTIAAPLGIEFEMVCAKPDNFSDFRKLKLLPNYDRCKFEDKLSGTRSDHSFEVYEAHLETRSTDSEGRETWTTRFRGQCFYIGYPAKFLGTTILLRDAGMFNRFGKPGKEFSRVGLVSSEFEKAFEAWSTDQMEARYLLDPIVLERFQALEKEYKGKDLRAAFDQNGLFLAIETGDSLKKTSIFKPMEVEERIVDILTELASLLDLADMTIKPVEGHMSGEFSKEDVRGKLH
ncbi:MAG: DUF3137 domain-containing protein [bacterium]